MLLAASALKNLTILAEDGTMGHIDEVLFDDRRWTLRWLAIKTGGWLSSRKVLLPPSVATADFAAGHLQFRLTRQQIKDSPDITTDQPVSRQMESEVYGHYGWQPLASVGYLGGTGMGEAGLGGGSMDGFAQGPTVGDMPLAGFGAGTERRAISADTVPEEGGGPNLRSATVVIGYHIQATDGPIGHLQDLLIESTDWSIRYLIVDTKNWWAGKQVLLSPHSVAGIDWASHDVSVATTQDQVKRSPPWDPARIVDEAYQRDLHDHYGWPGAGD